MLLLVSPPGLFELVVVPLIVVAILLVMFGGTLVKRLQHTPLRRRNSVTPLLWAIVFATGVYGGYFGAAQGVILMGVFGVLIAEPVQRQNALKNVLGCVVNVVASFIFVVVSEVDIGIAMLIALGSIFGGLLGARLGRRLSPSMLRLVIVTIGLIAVVKLLI